MHTYPIDLRQGAERLGALLARPNMACVDMGHTHYNELANDGGTIFVATRSTGVVRVRARDVRGREDEDVVEPAFPAWAPPKRAADGRDRDRVGSWLKKGILDTQLGPNCNGKKW